MELKSLRFFIRVAEELSFNRAAERLNSSQPVVTRTIAQLEHTIGTKLFERTTRKVKLTPAGELLLKEALPLIEHAEAVKRTVRHAVGEQNRKFIVGSTSVSMQTVTPIFIKRLRQLNPQIDIEVLELTSQDQIEKLMAAEIDIAFLLNPVDNPTLSSIILHQERLKLAVPTDHPRLKLHTDPGDIPLSTFSEDCFIIPSRQAHPAVHHEVIKVCDGAGFQPRFRECTESQTCLGLARAGLGVFFFSGRMPSFPTDGITILNIADPAPILEVVAAWRKDDPSTYISSFSPAEWRLIANDNFLKEEF